VDWILLALTEYNLEGIENLIENAAKVVSILVYKL